MLTLVNVGVQWDHGLGNGSAAGDCNLAADRDTPCRMDSLFPEPMEATQG